MKKILHLVQISLVAVCVIFSVQRGNAQSLLVENFDFEAATLLTSKGWTAQSGSGTQPVDVAVPGLTFTGYPLSNIGGMVQLDNNGEDVHKLFNAQTSGKVYVSFLVKVNAAADGYFLHLGGNPISTIFRGKVFVSGTADPFNFGASVGSNTATTVTGGAFSYGKTYLMVLKYEIVEGEKNDIVSLFIIDADVPSTEPSTPSIGPLTDTGQTDIIPASIALRQYNASQNINIDGMRIANSWAEAVTAPLAGDTFAPVFGSGYPKVTGISSSGATLEVALDEPGMVFYMLVPNNAVAPTAEQLISGVEYGGVNLIASGQINIGEAGIAYTKSFSNLGDDMDFDLYVLAQDDETTPNRQENPVKVEFHTSAPADVLLAVNFETSLEPFIQVSVTGEQEWKKATYNNNSYAYMNGYASGNKENEDWLITPALNLDTATNVKVSFRTATRYTGPAIKVMISSNFNGTFTPAGIAGATWTDITSQFELSAGDYIWKASGEYALSAYSGKVYIAFVYTSTTDGAAGWEVDDFQVTGYVKNTAIDQPATGGLKLYPVPARTELMIDNAGSVSRAEVFDISGRMHFSAINSGEPRMRIAVGHLNPGIYLLRFTTTEGTQVQKFIKE